jgi:hypothetical protein
MIKKIIAQTAISTLYYAFVIGVLQLFERTNMSTENIITALMVWAVAFFAGMYKGIKVEKT